VRMMSRRSRAKEIGNWYYRRCFEWKVFWEIEVEVEGPALVWAIGLDTISPMSGRILFRVLERGWTYGRFDRTFPVEETGIVICNRETLSGTRESVKRM